jgi:hypothetical protein
MRRVLQEAERLGVEVRQMSTSAPVDVFVCCGSVLYRPTGDERSDEAAVRRGLASLRATMEPLPASGVFFCGQETPTGTAC